MRDGEDEVGSDDRGWYCRSGILGGGLCIRRGWGRRGTGVEAMGEASEMERTSGGDGNIMKAVPAERIQTKNVVKFLIRG